MAWLRGVAAFCATPFRFFNPKRRSLLNIVKNPNPIAIGS